MTAPAPASAAPRSLLSTLSAVSSRWLVSAYKLLGFAILTAILVGITTFVGLRLLYLAHRSWVAPVVVSPTDPAVLDLQARIASEAWMRHEVLTERMALDVKRNRARLVAGVERDFQSGFSPAVGADVASGRESLDNLAALRAQQRGLALELARHEKELQGRSLEVLRRDREARLIDEEEFARQSYQLSQLTQARMSLAEKELELSDRIRRLARDVEARDAARWTSEPRARAASSYDTLLMRRERARSVAEAESAREEERSLEQAVAATDHALSEYDALLATLRASPLLRAASNPATMAFVPYENQTQVREGSEVFACRFAVVACRLIGRVKAYLPGEQTRPHPVFGHAQRGQLVELVLNDSEAVKDAVLHVHRPPLLF